MPPPELKPGPCRYRTGKTLGKGSFSIVKEAFHVDSGICYACKIINKNLMAGREAMVRTEVKVLKKLSYGHPNVVTLHDYFETKNNIYLCFNMCTGGELLHRIHRRGRFDERDAAALVKKIFDVIKYIHDNGIVHRDLKPDNLLFDTDADDGEIQVADFGLSRIMDEQKMSLLTEVCGTPGYMAPEIYRKLGHGKAMDIWSTGVIAYYVLVGYTPFELAQTEEEMDAVVAGVYRFEPEKYWANISDTAKDFITHCLVVEPVNRPTAETVLKHKWLTDGGASVRDPESSTDELFNLLPNAKEATVRKLAWQSMSNSEKALYRYTKPLDDGCLGGDFETMRKRVQEWVNDSDREDLNRTAIIHQMPRQDSAAETPQASTTEPPGAS